MKRLMHLNRTKALLIGGLAALVVVLLAVVFWPKERKLLASVASVSEQPGPENRQGRFTIKNTGTNALILLAVGVETFRDGTWQIDRHPSPASHVLLPAEQGSLLFGPPPSTNKWRGVLIVVDPQEELAAQTGGLVSLWRSIPSGFSRGFSWVRGTLDYDGEVVTREITP